MTLWCLAFTFHLAVPAAADVAGPLWGPAQESQESEILHGFEVLGSAEFRARTAAALELLAPIPEFAEIRGHLDRIRQFPCSGVLPAEPRTTFHVGERTLSAGPIWYAGVIAHDAYHVVLYRRVKKVLGGLEPPVSTYGGTEAERSCIEFQIRVLRAIGADEGTLAYLAEVAKDPRFHQQGVGALEFGTGTEWDICRSRDW